ncbi:MAG TPA: SRPBCC family protein [Nocardioidaceae bacterium]|nr:SRPBCC family protein [Nocardioidaceae bacterium]
MELRHNFTVPGSLADTWAAFGDITSVAECFPGAVVTRADGDDFEGTCKVKLGPVALVYSGSGRFVEKDEAEGRFVLEAKGKDKRGNGTAGAAVTATLTSVSSGTAVEVVTDLQITGKPAQFGRGVIQDVSDKLLQQFSACLEQKLTPAPSVEAGPEPGRAAVRPLEVEDQDDALDVGAALLPVLIKSYGKQALAVVLLVAVLLRWLRRR